jgi:predicted metal-binding membrane protein
LPLAIMLIATAWITLWLWDSSPYARYMHGVDWSATGLAVLCRLPPVGLAAVTTFLHVAAWLLMIVAMMLPTTLPLLRIFDRLTVAHPDRTVLLLLVVSGYLSVWSAFGLLAHVSDVALHQLVERMPWLVPHAWIVAAAILALAGAYQFSALKYRCLDKCRSPLMFVSEQWHGVSPRRDSLLLGARHGLFCVGCCWALMCLMFAVGMGSIGWMLAAGAVMATEKNLSIGRKLGAPLGVALLGWATLIVVGGLRAG